MTHKTLYLTRKMLIPALTAKNILLGGNVRLHRSQCASNKAVREEKAHTLATAIAHARTSIVTEDKKAEEHNSASDTLPLMQKGLARKHNRRNNK